MLDLHTHLIGHQDRKAVKETIRAYLDKAVSEGLREFGFADHDMYWNDLNFPLIREVAGEYPQLKVRVGLEVDYRPEDESKIQKMLEQFPFDYVIGSVHEISTWCFDAPGQEPRHTEWDADELYRAYFSLVAQAARSGLFTTIGHFDLVKVYGVRPRADIVELAASALDDIARCGLVLEVNTNGRYKPIGEFYPELKLIKEAVARGIPFTLGSDAHYAETVGRDLPDAMQMLKEAGINSVVGFEQREKVCYPIE